VYCDWFRQKVASHPELDHCITGDEASHGKPDPDLFLLALGRWEEMRPEEVIVFEDSPLGIQAANCAGIPAVFVPDREMMKRGVFAGMTAKPLLTIASLEEFDFGLFRWAGPVVRHTRVCAIPASGGMRYTKGKGNSVIYIFCRERSLFVLLGCVTSSKAMGPASLCSERVRWILF
jgi:hypothetical protein